MRIEGTELDLKRLQYFLDWGISAFEDRVGKGDEDVIDARVWLQEVEWALFMASGECF